MPAAEPRKRGRITVSRLHPDFGRPWDIHWKDYGEVQQWNGVLWRRPVATPREAMPRDVPVGQLLKKEPELPAGVAPVTYRPASAGPNERFEFDDGEAFREAFRHFAGDATKPTDPEERPKKDTGHWPRRYDVQPPVLFTRASTALGVYQSGSPSEWAQSCPQTDAKLMGWKLDYERGLERAKKLPELPHVAFPPVPTNIDLNSLLAKKMSSALFKEEPDDFFQKKLQALGSRPRSVTPMLGTRQYRAHTADKSLPQTEVRPLPQAESGLLAQETGPVIKGEIEQQETSTMRPMSTAEKTKYSETWGPHARPASALPLDGSSTALYSPVRKHRSRSPVATPVVKARPRLESSASQPATATVAARQTAINQVTLALDDHFPAVRRESIPKQTSDLTGSPTRPVTLGGYGYALESEHNTGSPALVPLVLTTDEGGRFQRTYYQIHNPNTLFPREQLSPGKDRSHFDAQSALRASLHESVGTPTCEMDTLEHFGDHSTDPSTSLPTSRPLSRASQPSREGGRREAAVVAGGVVRTPADKQPPTVQFGLFGKPLRPPAPVPMDVRNGRSRSGSASDSALSNVGASIVPSVLHPVDRARPRPYSPPARPKSREKQATPSVSSWGVVTESVSPWGNEESNEEAMVQGSLQPPASPSTDDLVRRASEAKATAPPPPKSVASRAASPPAGPSTSTPVASPTKSPGGAGTPSPGTGEKVPVGTSPPKRRPSLTKGKKHGKRVTVQPGDTVDSVSLTTRPPSPFG